MTLNGVTVGLGLVALLVDGVAPLAGDLLVLGFGVVVCEFTGLGVGDRLLVGLDGSPVALGLTELVTVPWLRLTVDKPGLLARLIAAAMMISKVVIATRIAAICRLETEDFFLFVFF